MDQQSIPPPPAPAQNPTVPASPAPQPKKGIPHRLFPIFLVVGAIFFGAFIYYLIQKLTTKPLEPEITTVIVTPTPSPTPFRYPTNVSTSSGFLLLEESISSFSAELDKFSKDDPSLSPPNLILPIGL
jgi:hypothetical protein